MKKMALILVCLAIMGVAVTVTAKVVGPDTFGYWGIDETMPGGPTFNWIDISTSGNAVYLSDDDYDGPFPIGFPFNFYGNTYTEFYISSNGYIGFASTYMSRITIGPFPNPDTPNDVIAGLNVDLHPGRGGVIYYYTEGTSPSQRLIVQYKDVPYFSSGGGVDFEIILDQGTGNILCQYLDVAPDNGVNSMVGIENSDGSVGLTFHNREVDGLYPGKAILFTTQRPTGLFLVPGNQSKSGEPLSSVIYNETILNMTGTTQTVNLSLIQGKFPASLSQNSFVLGDGEGADLTVQVDIPFDAPNGFSDTTIVNAIIPGNPEYKTSATLTTSVRPGGFIQISSGLDDGEQPDIAFDSDENVHIVWTEYYTTESAYEIHYKMLDNNGNVLIGDTLLTEPDGEYSKRPSIEIDSRNHAHVVWQDWFTTEGAVEIKYIKFDPFIAPLDGSPLNMTSATLVSEKLISEDDGNNSKQPDLAIGSDDEPRVVWNEGDIGTIMYAHLDNNGNILYGPIQLIDYYTDTWRGFPNLEVDSQNNAHICWVSALPYSWEEPYYVWYSMIDNTGNVVITNSIITPFYTEWSRRPQLDIDNNDRVNLVWHDWEAEEISAELWFIQFDPYLDDRDGSPIDLFNTLTALPKRLTPVDGFRSKQANIAIGPDNRQNVIWVDENGIGNGHNLFFRRWEQDGYNLTPVTDRIQVTYNANVDSWSTHVPRILVDSHNAVHLAWHQEPADDSMNIVYYTKLVPPTDAELTITSTNTSPTTVSRGETGILVEMTVHNAGTQRAVINNVGLRFTGSADRTSEYNVIPDAGNPTVIDPGDSEVFRFLVDVALNATVEHIEIGGFVEGEDYYSGNPISDYTVDSPDSWDVLPDASLVIDSIVTAPTEVYLGQQNIQVTMNVSNPGAHDATIDSAGLTFTGAGDRTSDYIVTPDPTNPGTVPAGGNTSLQFSVDVKPNAHTELITIDGTISGTDAFNGNPCSDDSATVTDSWQVLASAQLNILSINAVPDFVYRGDTGNTVTVTIENLGDNPLQLTSATLTMTALSGDVTGEYSFSLIDGLPVIPPADSRDLTFLVDAGMLLTGGEIAVDAEAGGRDMVNNTFTYDIGAETIDTWYVVVTTQTVVVLPGQTLLEGAGIIGDPDNQHIGVPFNADVYAVDEMFYIDKSAGETITVSTTDPYDTEPPAQALANGTAQFSIVPALSGSWQVIPAGGPGTNVPSAEYFVEHASDYNFDEDPEGWQFSGPIPPFDSALSYSFNGQLIIEPTNNTNCFGFWYSPADALTPVPDSLYRARYRLSTNVTDPEMVPSVRLRANSANEQQSNALRINSLPDGSYAPTPAGKDYDLYFVPYADGTYYFSFDLLNFDPTDSSAGAVFMDSLVVDRFPLSALSGETIEVESELGNWDFVTPSGVTAPIGSITTDTLTGEPILNITATDNTNNFGYWDSGFDEIVISADRFYKARFTVSSDVPESSMVPVLRLRVNTEDLQQITLLRVNSVDGGVISPTPDGVVYDVFVLPPAGSVGASASLSFDLGNFDPSDDPNGTLSLHKATVFSYDVPAIP